MWGDARHATPIRPVPRGAGARRRGSHNMDRHDRGRQGVRAWCQFFGSLADVQQRRGTTRLSSRLPQALGLCWTADAVRTISFTSRRSSLTCVCPVPSRRPGLRLSSFCLDLVRLLKLRYSKSQTDLSTLRRGQEARSVPNNDNDVQPGSFDDKTSCIRFRYIAFRFSGGSLTT